MPVHGVPRLRSSSFPTARRRCDLTHYMPELSQSDAAPVPGASSPGAQWPWSPRSATCALLSDCPPPPGSCTIRAFPSSLSCSHCRAACRACQHKSRAEKIEPIRETSFCEVAHCSDTLLSPAHASRSIYGKSMDMSGAECSVRRIIDNQSAVQTPPVHELVAGAQHLTQVRL